MLYAPYTNIKHIRLLRTFFIEGVVTQRVDDDLETESKGMSFYSLTLKHGSAIIRCLMEDRKCFCSSYNVKNGQTNPPAQRK